MFSPALYVVLFPRDKEAAFANYCMWEALGSVIAFAYSNFICLNFKIYILLAMLLVTTVTYPILEYHEWRVPTPPMQEGAYEQHSGNMPETLMEKNVTAQTSL